MHVQLQGDVYFHVHRLHIAVRLDDLCARLVELDFPAIDEHEHPEREAVVAARQVVTDAVRDDEFLVDCMARELDLVERRTPRHGLVPFCTLPGQGIGIAFGYWPPGARAGAHEHTAWTITAVCRNELTVRTYDREGSYRRRTLVPKNLFDASAGRVGFIYEPCIHDPMNPTDRWSLSLHVQSPRDGERLGDHDEACLPMLNERRDKRLFGRDDPYTSVLEARHRRLVVHQIAGLLAGTELSAADGLLARCAELGSSETRRFVNGLHRVERRPATGGPSRRLVRTGHGLVLGCRDLGDLVVLGTETSWGWVEELSMASVAREAIEFCARATTFREDELPGRLTEPERHAIVDALEQSGLFQTEVTT